MTIFLTDPSRERRSSRASFKKTTDQLSVDPDISDLIEIVFGDPEFKHNSIEGDQLIARRFSSLEPSSRFFDKDLIFDTIIVFDPVKHRCCPYIVKTNDSNVRHFDHLQPILWVIIAKRSPDHHRERSEKKFAGFGRYAVLSRRALREKSFARS